MSFITIFLGAVGGVVAFGFIGIFLGPTLLAVGLSLLQEFTSERAAKSAPASPPQSQPSPSLKSEISDPKSQI